jgi:hypothetical protein
MILFAFPLEMFLIAKISNSKFINISPLCPDDIPSDKAVLPVVFRTDGE